MAKVSDQLREDYRRILRRARAEGTDQAIGNRYPWQCREAVQELLDFAREQQEKKPETPVEVLVITASFPNYVFGNNESVKQAKSFLQNGGKMRVLIWAKNPKVHDNDMFLSCRGFPEFIVRKTGMDEYADRVAHFLVASGSAFRLEAPHKISPACSFDDFKPEIPARISFNDSKLGGELVSHFHHQWKGLAQSL